MEYTFQVGDDEHAVTVEKRGEGYVVNADGRELDVELVAVGEGRYVLVADGEVTDVVIARDGARRYVAVNGYVIALDEGGEERAGAVAEEVVAGVQTIRAPMPGKVVKVAAAAGDAVAKGQTVVVVEAMKMEHRLAAAGPGVIKSILCAEGRNVAAAEALAEVEVEGDQ